MTPQEQSLIAGCVRGEKAAWDAFVEQYAKLVYHTIKITANFRQAETPPDFADDLFQEIFLTLVTDDFAQLRRFRGDNGCTLASWLRMIAARRTIDHLRKHRHRTELVTDAHGNQQDNPELAASEGQLQESLARALESLTAHERILIKLFFYRNLFCLGRRLNASSVCRRILHPEEPYPRQAARNAGESGFAVKSRGWLRLSIPKMSIGRESGPCVCLLQSSQFRETGEFPPS